MQDIINESININLVSDLTGVGPKIKDSFHKVGIDTIEDLLFWLPKSYEDRTRLTSLNMLKVGESALCEGKIIKTLINDKISHGNGQVKWDGKSDDGIMMSSGLYFYRLSSSDYEETKKIVLLR